MYNFTPQPGHFDALLQYHIKQICNCTNFLVNASLLYCIDDNKALYAVQLTGTMVDKILYLWTDYEMYNSHGTDVRMATISLCNDTCLTDDQKMSKSFCIIAQAYLVLVFAIVAVMFSKE